MKSVALNAFPRTLGRRAGAKKLRADGRIPAVIYGRTQAKPQNLEIKLYDLKEAAAKAASEILLLDLTIEGDAKPKRLALVQDVQHHTLTGQILHLDLHEVAEDERVVISVPAESVGEAVGVKTGGGILEHVLFKVKVRALPKDLPEALLIDVSHLEIGQSIHIGDIKPPPGVEILGDKHISVLSVAAPITEAEEAAAAEAATLAPGEVEMLKEKKEEGEEGEEGKPAEKGKPGEKAAAAKPGEKAPAGKPGEKAPAGKPGEKAPAAPAAGAKPAKK